MKTLTKKFKDLFFPCVYTDRKRLLKAIEDDSYEIDTDFYTDGTELITREIEYFDGWINLDFTIERIANPYNDPMYDDSIDERIVGIELKVYNQYDELVKDGLTYSEIYNAIKHLVNY